jgi:hypothetical protein
MAHTSDPGPVVGSRSGGVVVAAGTLMAGDPGTVGSPGSVSDVTEVPRGPTLGAVCPQAAISARTASAAAKPRAVLGEVVMGRLYRVDSLA